MNAAAILRELERRGVLVTADGDALVLKPKRALDDALLARVREHKPEIIRAVSAPKAPDTVKRFGQRHARLFPFIGRKVWTPGGTGTLLQVFADRATVILDSQLSQCTAFAPAEIEPVSAEA
jgi:hypothetical protein